ncbi:hypothetical protein KAJ89_02810 [Candidatus Parcubacteria bacterium]|nr:hypothetical protein [Candidatus Parcubacteria bacterium]
MILFKIGVFFLFCSFVIWLSNYDPILQADLNHVCGPQPKKNPSRFLDITLIFFILFGCALMAYFMPTEKVGIPPKSWLGMFIWVIAAFFRERIHN